MKVQDERETLVSAIAAIRRGDRAEARELIYAVLEEDPRNVAAWSWACEAATTPSERVYCLERILSIDPSHEAARRYLARLRDETSAAGAPIDPVAPRTTVEDAHSNRRNAQVLPADLLLLPLKWLFEIPLPHLFLILLALALAGGLVYFRANTDFFGLAGPDFDALTVSDSHEKVAADDVYWQITFEGSGASEFSGVVRHVSPIHLNELRILTHDVLVTSGDYADPDAVSTSVSGHRFRWRSSSTARPSGRINLLHTVPANEKVYRQLLAIRTWDEVIVTGQEILVVKAYDRDGSFLGEWRDTGCNTLLVESVVIVEK